MGLLGTSSDGVSQHCRTRKVPMAVRWSNFPNARWQLNAYLRPVSTIEWARRYVYVKSNKSSSIYCTFNVTQRRNWSITNEKCEIALDFGDQNIDIILVHKRDFQYLEMTSDQTNESNNETFYVFTFCLRCSILIGLEHSIMSSVVLLILSRSIVFLLNI